jgi:hypothetical protein
MKPKSNDAKDNEVGNGADRYTHGDDPIKESNSSKNDETDKRISEEQGTKRIRNQRQSIKEAQKNRHRPLL